MHTTVLRRVEAEDGQFTHLVPPQSQHAKDEWSLLLSTPHWLDEV